MNVMRKITQFTAGLLVGLVLGVASPGSADTITPQVVYPIGDGGPVVVQVDAPPGSWRIRQSARRLDSQLFGVTVRTSGDCSTADMCVHVAVGAWDVAQMDAISGVPGFVWAGWTAFPEGIEGKNRMVYLNASQAFGHYRQYVGVHEMAHVLGLDHHQADGVLGPRQALFLSPGEQAVLDAYYGVTP